MTSRPSALLTSADLPYVELQAAALDGDVFRVDRAFCSVAEIDVPWRRATALAPLFGTEFVVAGLSAAWVWGALAEAPITHEAFGDTRRTHRDIPAGTRVRAARTEPVDLVDFGPVRVTSPVRTVVDLVRREAFGDEAAEVVRFLVSEHGIDRGSCEALLTRSPHLPHKRRARQRLDAAGLADVAADGATRLG
ncbi:hypothetical protein AX769_13135 [Frondihabitans sp. PAMC 28766]|uniref:type IV toxin-antitoxin system AbiEi family antitoxin n=1 Tax=Frondihabitans sp. PAMC 28766 TaxID=1795630 RepID=UPI00078E7A71|nr:type IV toxin-antitoxin system AbiEi family antitoxin [Frondihabitans sp. PAMC 28766]AMM20912.1 hypothetical protein AX769_13135 [Frondihabitans sp. PAMC 28766]